MVSYFEGERDSQIFHFVPGFFELACLQSCMRSWACVASTVPYAAACGALDENMFTLKSLSAALTHASTFVCVIVGNGRRWAISFILFIDL